MTVQILRLTGLADADAEEAAAALLDDLRGHPDLRRLLVLDDTAMLVQHARIYEGLITGKRIQDLLCVALGPRAGNSRVLQLPGNLGGTQGSGVLWVSDPSGIDWRVAAAAIAIGHAGGSTSGLDHLLGLLSVEEIFDGVHAVITQKVPGKVASPGLRLAGADDEAATFAGALAVASRRLTEPGLGSDEPFPGLLPAAAGGVRLLDGGELSRCRDDVIDSVRAATGALARQAGIGGIFRRGYAGVREHVIEAGAALADLRHQVDQLLQEADATGRLSEKQHARVLAVGVQLPAPTAVPTDGGTGPGAPPQSLVHLTIADAIRGGDPLVLVIRRLGLTERELKRRGSASYAQEAERRCPASLPARLADPPQRPSRPASGGDLRDELGLDEAKKAADRLADLMVDVGNREWSTTTPTSDEVARIRIALDGVVKVLTEHAASVADTSSGARGARRTWLGEILTPTLRELVLKVLVAESASPSVGGQEAFEHARDRTAGLLAEWTRDVRTNGVLARPSFATFDIDDAPYADEGDVAEVKEAVLYQPGQVMWQLCGRNDLAALDATVSPQAVWFAPRLNKAALAADLPSETVWTASGSYAGLLRLVPLRAGTAFSSWGSDALAVAPADPAELWP